jgi:transposase
VEDYIGPENPVRIFDAFVDTLDMKHCRFVRPIAAAEGRPGYDPKDLLKLYIYGYFNGIRSSRRLAKESQRNVELMWLLRKLTPDFRTISDFRKENKHALKEVFREFNRLCDKLELYTKEYIAIDGSKFKAVNGKDRNFTQGKLDDRLKRIDEHITEYLIMLDKADGEEGEERQFSRDEIAEKVKGLKERKAVYEGYQAEMEKTGEKQLSLTDPESRLMKFSEGGFNVGYNVQTAVDTGSHLIADFQVTDHPADSGLLEEVARGVKEAFSMETIETVADKGYQNKGDMMNCLEAGIIPHVFPAKGEDGFDLETEYEERDIGEAQRKSLKAEDIKACLRAGVIPEAYRGVVTKAEVVEKKIYGKRGVLAPDGEPPHSEEELLAKAKEGYFVRDLAMDMVYCPCGNILRAKSARKNGVVRYCNKMACAHCKKRCTTSKYKEVDFNAGDTLIACIAYGQDGKEKAAKNHAGTKLQRKIQVVRIRFTVDRKKLDNRKCLSEHPFGTVKRALGSAYLLLKGKQKTTGELSLVFMAYNIKRAITMRGVGNLLAVL